MSEEKQYVTVRIPKFFDHLINKYMEAHQEEMRLLGQRTSRAAVVKKALYEFLKREGIIQETPHSVKIQGDTSKPDKFSAIIKETFLAHSIVSMAKGKTLPSHHLDSKRFEQSVRRYIAKRAKQEDKKVTKEYLDELTRELLEYHKQILEGLALMTRH